MRAPTTSSPATEKITGSTQSPLHLHFGSFFCQYGDASLTPGATVFYTIVEASWWVGSLLDGGRILFRHTRSKLFFSKGGQKDGFFLSFAVENDIRSVSSTQTKPPRAPPPHSSNTTRLRHGHTIHSDSPTFPHDPRAAGSVYIAPA